MKRLLIPCLILAFACPPGAAHAQRAEIRDQNSRMMDSLQMEVFSIWCRGELDYPHSYNKQKSRRLTHILQNLNSISSDTLTRAGLLRGIANFRDCEVRVDTTQFFGDLTFFEVQIDLPSYLRARLGFACLGNFVIAQRFELQPETIAFCSDHNQGFFDFNFCKSVYAPVMDFPLRYARQEYFYFMRLSATNRSAAAAAYPQYAPYLALDSTNAPARLLSESYIYWGNSTYNLSSPDPRFVDLVRTANGQVLKSMLYSPYYYYAINAMEALTYMASTRQLTLSADIRNRIENLKNAHEPFVYKNFDVVYRMHTYSTLKLTDQQIVEKYRIALSAH